MLPNKYRVRYSRVVYKTSEVKLFKNDFPTLEEAEYHFNSVKNYGFKAEGIFELTPAGEVKIGGFRSAAVAEQNNTKIEWGAPPKRKTWK